VFDIEADTRVRNYRLTLQANGTLDRVSTRITSDPPLTSAQIASVLTGGDENDVASSGASTADINALAVGAGGGTIVSSWLDDNVTGRFAQGFGLSRLSIDPGRNLLSARGARVTVGKRVTRDLEVVYSGPLSSGTDTKLVTAEYSLSNRFSLVLSWQDPGGVGIDGRARFVLGRK
jgi:translocation and assembly module TamB